MCMAYSIRHGLVSSIERNARSNHPTHLQLSRALQQQIQLLRKATVTDSQNSGNELSFKAE